MEPYCEQQLSIAEALLGQMKIAFVYGDMKRETLTNRANHSEKGLERFFGFQVRSVSSMRVLYI